jgi:ABC-type nitrate/sulfonate/bicarbonate transport system permease component
MRKFNQFLRSMTQVGASGALLYGGGGCTVADNFWVDATVTARDSIIAEAIAAIIGIPLGLLGL